MNDRFKIYLGFDVSGEYISSGCDRLASTRVGDDLKGAAEPKVSAPATNRKGRTKK